MRRREVDVENTKTREFADYLKSRQSYPTYFWGTIIGILVGAVFALAGFVLVLLGVSGAIDWLVEMDDFKAKMINAGPGVVFAVLGTIILWRYKPSRREMVDFDKRMLYKELELSFSPEIIKLLETEKLEKKLKRPEDSDNAPAEQRN